MYVCVLFIHTLSCIHTCIPWHMCEGQKYFLWVGSLFFSVWVLGIKIRLSAFRSSTSPSEPSCLPTKQGNSSILKFSSIPKTCSGRTQPHTNNPRVKGTRMSKGTLKYGRMGGSGYILILLNEPLGQSKRKILCGKEKNTLRSSLIEFLLSFFYGRKDWT